MTNTFSNTIIYNFWKIHSVTIVANQSTLANVRNNKYFREGTITVKVSEAEPDVAVKQTGAKKITMTGKELTDVVTDYVLKRGTVTVELEKVAFTTAEDKNSVDLFSKSSRLIAGEYSLKFKENEAITFTVETSALDHFDIPSDTLPLDGEYGDVNTKSATVSYHAYNQFNEDITKSVSTVRPTSSFGTANGSSSKGEITVNFATGTTPLLGTTGTIVLVDTATGISYSKTLTLGMKAKADLIEILGVYNTKTKTAMSLTENSKNEDAAILVKVSDQYGGDMKVLDCVGEVAFTFNSVLTGVNVAGAAKTNQKFETLVEIDGIDYVAIPLSANNAKAGTIQVFFVSTSTGKTAQETITVNANATIKSIDIYPVEDVYVGKEAEFGFTALTEDGSSVTDYDVLSNKDYGVGPHIPNGNINCSFGTFSWRKNSDGSAKLVFMANGSGLVGSSGLANATFMTAGHGVKTITFTVMAQSIPTTIKGLKDGTILAAITGKSIKLTLDDFIIEDQYEKKMDTAALHEAFADDYVITVTGAATGVISNSLADIKTATPLELTMSNVATVAKAELTFQIKSKTGEVSKAEALKKEIASVPFSALEGFRIDTAQKVYANGEDDLTETGNGRSFKVYGSTAYGAQTVLVPTDYYQLVTYNTSDGAASRVKVLTPAGITVTTIGGIDGEGVAWVDASNKAETQEITIRVTIKGAEKVAEAKVTACEEVPVLTTIEAAPAKAGIVREAVNTFLINTTSGAIKNGNDLLAYLELKDQYGVTFGTADEHGTPAIVITYAADVKNVTVTGNGSNNPAIQVAGTTASYKATITWGGQSITVNVNIND